MLCIFRIMFLLKELSLLSQQSFNCTTTSFLMENEPQLLKRTFLTNQLKLSSDFWLSEDQIFDKNGLK